MGLIRLLILNRTPIFSLCVIGCGSKDGYLEHTCSKEIGRCVQNLLTVLCSIANLIRGGGGRTYIENYKENWLHGRDTDFLTFWYSSHVSYITIDVFSLDTFLSARTCTI